MICHANGKNRVLLKHHFFVGISIVRENVVCNQNQTNLRLRLLSTSKQEISRTSQVSAEARPALGVPKAFLGGIPVPDVERE
jgi:hypothetical protein